MAERARRILVVEDDAPVRELIARHLETKGYRVEQASDAEQVLLTMSRDRQPFDLVLTDIHLPGLSGVELLRLLLTHSPLRPVIMITGDADESLARRALGHGATAYLLKPFQLFEVEAAVQQAIARLDLVEAAEALARSDGAERGGGSGASIPQAWLELADARSAAGAGHGHRVARLASALAATLQDALGAGERAALETAARAHELGRLLGPTSTQPELAARTAQLLYDLGIEPGVIRIVKNFRERWDGGGGPKGIGGTDIPLASRVLAAAEAIDHAAVARLGSGLDPAESIAGALDDVRRAADGHHGPEVRRALDVSARVIEAIWVLARGPSARSVAAA